MFSESVVNNFRNYMKNTPPSQLPTPRNPIGAYDAALTDEGSNDLREFLASVLSQEDYETACKFLDDGDGDDEEDDDTGAMDEPEPFSGRHRPGGKDDPLAAKNRLRQASDSASVRNQARYKLMFPGSALIRTNVFGQDASLEDFHGFLDSLDKKQDPNRDPNLDAEPDDLLDPKNFVLSASSRKQAMVDDEGEEISEELRRHLKAKLAPDHFKEMTARFDRKPAMDSARLRYYAMFPGASKIRSI